MVYRHERHRAVRQTREREDTASEMALLRTVGGPGLGACWGEELAQEMLREAGFADLESHELPHDILNVYFVARPG